jgi:ankyrin repeat protein
MSRCAQVAALMILAVLSLCCSGEVLPEAYGTYARSRGTLTELSPGTFKPPGASISQDAEFIVFAHGLHSIDHLTKEVGIIENYYMRSEVQEVIITPDGSPKNHHIRDISSWEANATSFLPSGLVPIDNKADMIVIRPKKFLPPGVYSIVVQNDQYPFVVGDGEKLSKTRRCFDLWLKVMPKNAPFSWENWMTQSMNMDKPRTPAGDFILASSLKECSDLERLRALPDLQKALAYYGTTLGPDGKKLLRRYIGSTAAPPSLIEGFSTLELAVDVGDVNLLEELLKKGLKPEERGKGWPPLYTACVKGDINMVRLLLQYGANPNQDKGDGWTPLFGALSGEHLSDPVAIVRLLLDKGADSRRKSPDGRLPYDEAKANGFDQSAAVLAAKTGLNR